MTHLGYKRSWGQRTVSIKPIRNLVWDWPLLLPATPGGALGGILAKLGDVGRVQSVRTRGCLKLTDRPKGQNSGVIYTQDSGEYGAGKARFRGPQGAL